MACRRGSRAVATPRRVGDDVAMLRVHGVHGGEERGTCPAHRRRARFEMRHVRWSACRPGPRFFSEGNEHRRTVATYRRATGRDEARATANAPCPREGTSTRFDRSLPPLGSQALVNCGHVYHLSCIHRWFNCKKDAASERRGGRRAPPHAPCPKCKEPFDMGSTVTIYLDLVKGPVTAAPHSAAKPKRRAAHHRAGSIDDERVSVVPESPTEDDDAILINANRRRTRGNTLDGTFNTSDGSFTNETREELESLREETRLASARAREAEDALAAAEIRREAESAEDLARDAEVARLERELARAQTLLTEAKYKERQAVTKATKATGELCDARTELQRLRASVQSLETQRKLERDLSDRNGAARGAAELAARFGEGSGLDPRVAVETLCRALAGKNRQMHAQMEEYAKLTKSLRAAERARKSAEARAASVTGEGIESANRANGTETFASVREGVTLNVSGNKRARAHRDADTKFLNASRVSRGWGREDGAYDDMEDAAFGSGGPSSSFPSAFSSLEKHVNALTFETLDAKDGHLSRKTARATSRDLRGGGPLSRVPAAAKKHKSRGKSGEDLLDDILETIDANAEEARAKKHPKHPLATEKKFLTDTRTRGGFDLASLASRRSRLGAADENDCVDLTADDASGGGGGSFIIHGADGRGGRAKIVRPGGGQASLRAASGGAGASGSLDRFLTRG